MVNYSFGWKMSTDTVAGGILEKITQEGKVNRSMSWIDILGICIMVMNAAGLYMKIMVQTKTQRSKTVF